MASVDYRKLTGNVLISMSRAAPDGHTLLLTTAVDAWNTADDNLRFNYLRDLAPVASIARGMGVLIVNGLPNRSDSDWPISRA
jgi:hypothetical protein